VARIVSAHAQILRELGDLAPALSQAGCTQFYSAVDVLDRSLAEHCIDWVLLRSNAHLAARSLDP
jgi:hypothetical protein